MSGEVASIETGEVLGTPEHLASCGERIHAAWKRGQECADELVECYLTIGHVILEARRALPQDGRYGKWYDAQGFPFSARWAITLRTAAEYEDEIRRMALRASEDGESFNLMAAVALAKKGIGPGQKSASDREKPDDCTRFLARAKKVTADLIVSTWAPTATPDQIQMAQELRQWCDRFLKAAEQ